MDLHLDRIKNIPPLGWALVVAGAAFGGAILHQSRLVGGAIVGGLALAFELSQAPCCAGCASGKAGCAGVATANPGIPTTIAVGEPTAAGAFAAQQNVTTTPLVNDYVGTAGAGVDPANIWHTNAYQASDVPKAATGCAGCS